MIVDCYQFPLGGVDLILHVAWLETLGEIQANWRIMTLKFQYGNCEIFLQGDTFLNCSPVSLRSLKKTRDVDYAAILWPLDTQLKIEHVGDELFLKQLQELKKMIGRFGKIFENDHHIPVQPRMGPISVSVKPYKYGHTQKNEIEILKEMLVAEIIRPSDSPFLMSGTTSKKERWDLAVLHGPPSTKQGNST